MDKMQLFYNYLYYFFQFVGPVKKLLGRNWPQLLLAHVCFRLNKVIQFLSTNIYKYYFDDAEKSSDIHINVYI